MKKSIITIIASVLLLSSCQSPKPPQNTDTDSTDSITPAETDAIHDIGVKKVRPSVADLVQVPDEPETYAPIEPGIYGTEESQGLEYQLEGDSYTVVGMGTCTDTMLVIPVVHEGLPVKAIGEFAFKEQNQITSVVIPEGVEKLCVGAFGSCAALRNVRLPSTLRKMEESVFSTCVSLVEIVIPENISEIPQYSFIDCNSLQRVILPSSTRLIDNFAFYGCENLCSINLPEGLVELGSGVFSGCHSLKNIHVPSTIQNVGSSCLRTSSDLSDGNKITPEGWIHNLYYDGTMEQFLEFSSNPDNTKMMSGAVNFYIDGELVEYLTITEGMKIPDMAFYSCQSLRGVILPAKVFDNPKDLYSVIGRNAFADCPNLEWVVVQGILPEDSLFDEYTCWLLSVMPQYSLAVYNNPEAISTVESIALFVTAPEENTAPYLTTYQHLCNEDLLTSSRMPGTRIYYAGEWEFNAAGIPIIK